MKFKQNWKRIFAGLMAAIMVFLSVDAGCLTALAAEIQEQKDNSISIDMPAGYIPLEAIAIDIDDFTGEVYDYQELANVELYSEIYNNEWDKYSTNYFYNQLSDEWKAVWEATDRLCMSYLISDIDAESMLLFGASTDMIALPENTLTTDAVLFANLFMASNPQYYFLGGGNMLYTCSEDYVYMYRFALPMYEAFADGEVRLEETEKFKTAIETALDTEKISSDASESDKLKYAHDYIVTLTDYNYDILSEDGVITDEEDEQAFSQSAFSTFCMDETVCAGYAEALQILCNGLDVDSLVVTSNNHMWNIVRINDSWYNVDATWADNGKDSITGAYNPIYYGYYGRSDEFYTELDTNGNSESHIRESMWDGLLPKCSLDTEPKSLYVPGDFYVPTENVPTPIFSMSKTIDGNYLIDLTVNAGDENEYKDAAIYYTVDGTVPSVASTKSTIYTEPFVVDKDTVIKAIAVLDGYADSEIGEEIAVLQVKNVANKSHFYQKQTFVWDSMGEAVDGYIIKVWNKADLTQIGDEIDITNGNANFYLYDTSALTQGTSIYYEIYAYCNGENGEKIAATEATASKECAVNQLLEPLDVTVKWHVTTSDGTNLLVVNVEEDTQDKLTLWYFTDKNGINSLNNFTLDMTDGSTEFKYSYANHAVAYEEVGYVLITDKGKTTAFQENGFAVGGEYKEPVLKPIEDVQLESTDESVRLKAEIADDSKMKNFNYKYQWYVADDYTSAGTPIEGATSDEYEVKIGSYDEKYYYCEVTAEYLTKNTYQTQNALTEEDVDGKHTRVLGALYNTEITPDKIENQVYDGTAKTPNVILKNELNETLILNTDYTLSYSNNTNAGQAIITVDYIGNYDSLETAIINFNILPKQATKDSLEFTDVVTGKEYIYNGTPFTPAMEVKDPERNVMLVPEGDYDIVYNANTDAGTATITMKFKGNYDGRVVIDFEIQRKSAENVTIESIEDQTFTGQPIVPALTIKDGEKLLVLDKDYAVTCTKNTHVGVSIVTIEFIGNYIGEKETKFDIVSRDASEVLITGIANQEYTGVEIEPTLEVIYRNTNDYAFVLTKGTDYEVAFSSNVERGRANVTLTFKGDFKGTRTETFEIIAKSADNLTYNELESYTYDRTEHKPAVVVKNGELTLVEGTDYVVEYKDNINAGTAKAIVKFESFEGCSGNYSGTKELEFQIARKAATECIVELETLADYTFTGSALTPGVVVMDGEVELKERTEEMPENEGDYVVTYSDNVNAGKATVTITYINNYEGEASREFAIARKPITEEDIVVKPIDDQTYNGTMIIPENIVVQENVLDEETAVTLRPGIDYTVSAGAENTYVGTGVVIIHIELEGEGNYIYNGEDIEVSFNIIPRKASNVQITDIPKQCYTGQEITPALEVKDGDIVLVLGVDYTVEYTNNIEVGTEASVTIHFMGNFTGDDMTAYFTIIDPIPESITSSVFHISQTSGYISNITVGTTVYTLWETLNERDYVSIFDRSGNAVSGESALATGMIAGIIGDGSVLKSYTVIVTGDTNGDGKINITDMIAVKACTLKKSDLTGAYEKAADVNGDGKVNITDFIKVKATTLRKDTITGVAVN